MSGNPSVQDKVAALTQNVQSEMRNAVPVFAKAGVRDVLDGIRQWRLWYLMGSADMRRRYARAKLGQFWIMLASAIMITAMGLTWSFLWQRPVREMLPFIALGMVVWQFISGVLGEATTILTGNGRYFLNQYIAASTVILSLLYRQGATFVLNLFFPIILAVALGVPISFKIFLAVPGIALLWLSTFWMAFVIAILCTRFRDLIQIVRSLLQAAMFISPVLWKPELLPERVHGLVIWNPLASLLSIVRDPLLDRSLDASSWIISFVLAFGGFAVALPFIGRFRRRLIYWL